MIRFPTSFLLYLLVQIPLAIVTVLAVVLFAVLTCGACCLLLVPFVHVVILLPVYVLHRAYPLHFLAQFEAVGMPSQRADHSRVTDARLRREPSSVAQPVRGPTTDELSVQ